MSLVERSVVFPDWEVSAVLERRKTQFRRPVKLPGSGGRGPLYQLTCDENDLWSDSHCKPFRCPYGRPGDRLWVREAWCHKNDGGGFVYNKDGNLDSSCCWYRADGLHVVKCDGDGFTEYRKDGSEKSPWSRSIHMPRWASRITLEIVDVWVERLQDISEQDAIAEGVESRPITWKPDASEFRYYGWLEKHDQWSLSAVNSFESLWNKINGDGSWEANQWFWVVEFKREVKK